ncbi:hypothetical protein HDU78_009620, partial [Chytriomyces hyalinus]
DFNNYRVSFRDAIPPDDASEEPVPTAVDEQLEEPVPALVEQHFSDAKTECQDDPMASTHGAKFDEDAKRIHELRHSELLDDEKFRLKSGKIVEDVMYDKCRTFSHEHYIYSPDDPITVSLFTKEENLEIQTMNEKKPPDTYLSDDGLFHRFFEKFQGTKTLSDLKSKLFNSAHPELFEDDSNEQWICQLYLMFLQCIWINASKNNSCFAMDLSESWILSNPWQFVQNLFHDCKDIFVLGGEKGGIASQARKNHGRLVGGQVDMCRRAMGKRGDGYVRIFGSDVRDVAAIEAGEKWEGESATKAFVESQHILPKMLRDILWDMHNRFGKCPDALTQISIPGLAIYGNRCKRLSLDHVKGQVTRVESSDWFTLSMSGNVNENLEVFLEILLVRVWVLHNESIKPERISEKRDLFQQLRRKVFKKENIANKFKLGVAQPTPLKGKSRKKPAIGQKNCTNVKE